MLPSLFIALAVSAGNNPALALHYRVARVLRPSIRDDERTLWEMVAQRETLPPLTPGRRGDSQGFHSRFQDSAAIPLDILVDLGAVRPIDRIALFPISSVFQGEAIAGYGFPLHFQIEAAVDADFADAALICDWTASDEPARPEYPVQVLTPNLSARFLRLRILEHWKRSDGRYLSALGELMILSGGRNVAIGGTVEADSFTSLPDWSGPNLIDGQTDLGLPVKPEPSSSNGFLTKGERTPDVLKWVQLELPQPVRIDEVRLIPTQPLDAPSQYGHGFPRRFRVLASMTTNFASARIIADHTVAAFPNPGDNPVILPGDGQPARFVRLEAGELWHITNQRFALALAEMQVYENGRNMAAGAIVSASDIGGIQAPFNQVWQPEFLVDGFSSQNRLIELDEWLAGLSVREALDRRIGEIEQRILGKVEATVNGVMLWACVIIGALGTLMVYNKIRRRRMLLRQREEMRTRIARDLHDDLGSRLGGMRLISESLLHDSALPPSMRDDLDLIHRASGEANDAMRDMVWLLDTREGSRGKLVHHMRQMAPSVLGRVECKFEVEPVPEQELEFEFRRQVLFAFKESLGNITKHAAATKVICRIGGGAEHFRFEVRDDGKGFDVEDAGTGHGLENLRSRAETLGGSVSIDSQPGKGTRVMFDVPVRLGK